MKFKKGDLLLTDQYGSISIDKILDINKYSLLVEVLIPLEECSRSSIGKTWEIEKNDSYNSIIRKITKLEALIYGVD